MAQKQKGVAGAVIKALDWHNECLQGYVKNS